MKNRLRMETLEQRNLLTVSELDAFPQGYRSHFFDFVTTENRAYFHHQDEDGSLATWEIESDSTTVDRSIDETATSSIRRAFWKFTLLCKLQRASLIRSNG